MAEVLFRWLACGCFFGFALFLIATFIVSLGGL